MKVMKELEPLPWVGGWAGQVDNADNLQLLLASEDHKHVHLDRTLLSLTASLGNNYTVQACLRGSNLPVFQTYFI